MNSHDFQMDFQDFQQFHNLSVEFYDLHVSNYSQMEFNVLAENQTHLRIHFENHKKNENHEIPHEKY